MPSASETSSIASAEEVRKLRDKLDRAGKKLVFTNGCFDLLHAGHVRYLAQARALGDALVVALNSDASVTALKGPSRPVTMQEDRAEILKALRSVDAVCVFDEPRVTRLIEAIKPHVYAKGGDYTVASLNPEERAALDFVGAEIEILPLVEGRSTTNTLRKLAAATEAQPAEAAPKLRVAVLGSGTGSNFKAILDSIASGALHAEVVCAISDVADSGIIGIARESGVPCFVVDPGPKAKGFSDAAQKEVCEHLRRANPDVIVLAGFMRILREPVLGEFAGRIINLHPSLLPKFKGSNAVQRAIDDGEFESGTTIHLVTSELDGGPVLAQQRVPINVGDDAAAVHARIKEAEHELLPRVLADWKIRRA